MRAEALAVHAAVYFLCETERCLPTEACYMEYNRPDKNKAWFQH